MMQAESAAPVAVRSGVQLYAHRVGHIGPSVGRLIRAPVARRPPLTHGRISSTTRAYTPHGTHPSIGIPIVGAIPSSFHLYSILRTSTLLRGAREQIAACSAHVTYR